MGKSKSNVLLPLETILLMELSSTNTSCFKNSNYNSLCCTNISSNAYIRTRAPLGALRDPAN